MRSDWHIQMHAWVLLAEAISMDIGVHCLEFDVACIKSQTDNALFYTTTFCVLCFSLIIFS